MKRRCNWLSKVAGPAVVLVIAAQTTIAAPEGPWEWPDQGVGFGASGTNATVLALLAWSDGTNSALYVGGHFTHAGGQPVGGVARWNGFEWSSLGAGPGGIVQSMITFDDGSGEALFAAGDIGVKKWNGIEWASIEGGAYLSNPQYSLAAFDDGSGPALYSAGSGKMLYRWSGDEWTAIPIPAGVTDVTDTFALTVFGAPFSERLYAAGRTIAYPYVVSWGGKEWTSPGQLLGHAVYSMRVFDDGQDAKLYVAGQFNSVDGSPAKNIAAWNGRSWVKVDNGVPSGFIARDLAVVGDGPTSSLYMMGWDVYKLTGSAWEPLEPVDNVAMTGAGFDDGSGPRLHIGGQIWLDNTFKNIARQASSGSGAQCGDLTGDGFVNQQDLGILLADFGCTKGVGLCPGDCDKDGDTDQADLGILLSNWEKPCP